MQSYSFPMFPMYGVVADLIAPYSSPFLSGKGLIAFVSVTIGGYSQTIPDHPFANIFTVTEHHSYGSAKLVILINFNFYIPPPNRLYQFSLNPSSLVVPLSVLLRELPMFWRIYACQTDSKAVYLYIVGINYPCLS